MNKDKSSYNLEFKWSVSRARDMYGYNTCSLYVDGSKVSSCNGGGYDMKGTALGNWVAREFVDELRTLKPEDMPEESHWERAENRNIQVYLCKKCAFEYKTEVTDTLKPCPICRSADNVDVTIEFSNLGISDGKRVSDGRRFYGLTYHDPDFDPGKAMIGQDCTDRTFSGQSKGKTVEQAEIDGDSAGLERYQAFYEASSRVPTERHRVPLIDGAVGFGQVECILKAIGYRLERVPTRSRNQSVYILREIE